MCSLALNIKLNTPAPASRRGAGYMTDTNSVDYKPQCLTPPPPTPVPPPRKKRMQ